MDSKSGQPSFAMVEFRSEAPSFGGTFADDMMAETMHPSAAREHGYASMDTINGLCAAAFESASHPSVHGRSGVAVAATVLKWEQLLRDHPHDPMVRSPSSSRPCTSVRTCVGLTKMAVYPACRHSTGRR